tara:strand:- start:335 stop:448 length:114 start_codon:yes stop_codon:yes gene_type:complete
MPYTSPYKKVKKPSTKPVTKTSKAKPVPKKKKKRKRK